MDTDKNLTADPAGRQLRRSSDGRLIGGVCTGAARYLQVDPNILRLALAAAALIFNGAGVALYVLAWVVIPAEGRSTSIAEDMIKKLNRHPAFQEGMQKARDGLNRNVNTETKVHSNI